MAKSLGPRYVHEVPHLAAIRLSIPGPLKAIEMAIPDPFGGTGVRREHQSHIISILPYTSHIYRLIKGLEVLRVTF